MCKNLQLLGDESPIPHIGALSLNPTGALPSPEPPDWPLFRPILGLSREIPPPQNSEIPPKKKSTRPKNQRHKFMAG